MYTWKMHGRALRLSYSSVIWCRSYAIDVGNFDAAFARFRWGTMHERRSAGYNCGREQVIGFVRLMENPTHFASVARRLLPLVEAALALSKDEEVLNLLRSYGSNPAPVPDPEMSVSRPSLVGPSTRGQIRRRRNANPCTKCVASRQAVCNHILFHSHFPRRSNFVM